MKIQRILGTFWALAVLAAVPAAAAPGTIKFDEASFEVAESAGVAVITVERSQGEDGAVSVHYSTANGTAVAGQDYTAVSGTLTWAAGDESDKTFNVPILDDSAAEGAETIRLTLSQPTGGAAIDSQRGTSTLVIRSNDGGPGGDDNPGDDNPGDDPDDDNGDDDDDNGGPAGVIKFDERDYPALEQAGVAVISVERSGGETGTVSVRYSTADGTAVAGQDYTAVSGVLTWGPGDESLKTFTVPLRDDGVDEPAETVRLILSDPTGGATVSATRGTAVLIIGEDEDRAAREDDAQGVFRFDEREVTVIEGAGSVRIAVERQGGRNGAVTVQYATLNASALAGQDYTAVSGTLSWAAGERGTKFITIPILDDNFSEGNERLLVQLSSPSGGAVLAGERRTVSVLIADDDGQTGACVADADTLCLLNNRFKVEVVWRTLQNTTGVGHVVPVSNLSGLVWFFNPENIEMLVKVVNACGAPFNRFWIFFAATTDVSFTVTVTDTATGVVREYENPAGQAAEPVQDTVTFETCTP